MTNNTHDNRPTMMDEIFGWDQLTPGQYVEVVGSLTPHYFRVCYHTDAGVMVSDNSQGTEFEHYRRDDEARFRLQFAPQA